MLIPEVMLSFLLFLLLTSVTVITPSDSAVFIKLNFVHEFGHLSALAHFKSSNVTHFLSFKRSISQVSVMMSDLF